MGIKKTVWLGILILIFAPIVFAISYFAGVTTNVIDAIDQIVLAFIVAMAIGGVGLIYKGLKSNKTRKNKNIFEHVQAHLFYPKKARVRDPKRNMPRSKLFVITDLRKAYYIGNNLIKLVD